MKKNMKTRRVGVLAINGGKPVISGPLVIHNVGKAEIDAAVRVIKKGPRTTKI